MIPYPKCFIEKVGMHWENGDGDKNQYLRGYNIGFWMLFFPLLSQFHLKKRSQEVSDLWLWEEISQT